jgi:serine phosphatase RsbU (regulator of sigma subunit)
MSDTEGRRDRALADSFLGLISGRAGKHRRNLELLLSTIAELGSSDTSAALLDSTVDRALALSGAERGMLLLKDRQGELQVRVARRRGGEDLPLDTTYCRSGPREVMRSGESVCHIGRVGAEGLDLTESMLMQGVRTLMCAPLLVKGKSIGVLYVDSRLSAGEFSETDRSLFEALSQEIALAIEFSRLARKEHALGVARDIQEGLLPEGELRRGCLDAFGISLPCDETGGDYYDFLELPDDRTGLVIGDVTGHGVAAAILMATGRALLRAFSSIEREPARVVGLLNRALADDLDSDRFMSLFLGELQPGCRRLRYVLAGHCAPLLVRGSDGSATDLGGRGLALGIVRDHEYRLVGPIDLEPGDLLVLYTDGVVEARNEEKIGFGRDRLVASVSARREAPAREVARGILDDVLAFTGSEDVEDDLTTIVARIVD